MYMVAVHLRVLYMCVYNRTCSYNIIILMCPQSSAPGPQSRHMELAS